VVDVFEEVDELVRSDHYKILARRYLPWVGAALVAALVAALAVWGYSRYQLTQAQKASEAYATGLEALGRNDLEQAMSAFALAAKSPSPSYRSLALMQEAGIRLSQNRTNDAVGLLDQAAKASTAPVLSDAAQLKAAYVLLDTAPYATLEGRLKPLTDPKRPYPALAREALAVAKLLNGQTNAARSDFAVLSLLADSPQDVRDRARAAKQLIDSGEAGQLPAIVKAALALPPPPPAAAAPGPAGPDSENSQAGAAQ
jgi:hypothetical protein